MVTQEGELSQGQAVYCVVTVADPLQQSVRTQWVGDSVLMESTALYAHSSQDQAPTRVCAKLGMLCGGFWRRRAVCENEGVGRSAGCQHQWKIKR